MTTPDIIGYFFDKGGIFGVISAGLLWVVIYQQRKLDKKDIAIQALNDGRLTDAKDVQKDLGTVLSGNSQANQLLAAKIEAVKGNS